MSFAVTGRNGDTPKPVYSIAQSDEQGQFVVYDGSGAMVCAITAPRFADEQAVIEFLTGSVFKPSDNATLIKGA
ncbi:hypothetical protein ACRS8P_09940 [Burkholderia cenocepacia]